MGVWGCGSGQAPSYSHTSTLPHSRSRSRRRRSAHGFTLIEMIVATFLLAIGAVAALACISSATRTAGIAREYTQAALLAQQKFAEIEAQPDTLSGGDQTGEFGDEYPGYSWQQTTETTSFSSLVRVTLTIEWQSGARRRSAQFATYEMIPQEETTTSATP
jgi:general secretion pathway protein I